MATNCPGNALRSTLVELKRLVDGPNDVDGRCHHQCVGRVDCWVGAWSASGVSHMDMVFVRCLVLSSTPPPPPKKKKPSYFKFLCALIFERSFCNTFHYPFREIRVALPWYRLQQPQEQRYPVLQVHAGAFRVSLIHRTLTRITGSLTCVRDYSYACLTYTHRQRVITTFLTRKKTLTTLFLCCRRGSNLGSFGSRVRCSIN